MQSAKAVTATALLSVWTLWIILRGLIPMKIGMKSCWIIQFYALRLALWSPLSGILSVPNQKWKWTEIEFWNGVKFRFHTERRRAGIRRAAGDREREPDCAWRVNGCSFMEWFMLFDVIRCNLMQWASLRGGTMKYNCGTLAGTNCIWTIICLHSTTICTTHTQYK